MSDHDNAAPRGEHERNVTHAFTDPNPFLAEDRPLVVAGRTTPMQRDVNAVPEQSAD